MITANSADYILTKKQLYKYIKKHAGKNAELKKNKWFWPYTTVYKNNKLVLVFCKESKQ